MTAKELRPYRQAVRPIIARNRTTDALMITEERWTETLRRCGAYAETDGRTVFHRPTKQAAQALVKLGNEAAFDAVLETVAAMLLLQERDPRRFKSGRAFSVELARVVRRLGTLAIVSQWDQRAGRVRGVYRRFPLPASLALAELVTTAIGLAAKRIADTVQAEEARKVRLEGEYRASLEGIA
ncbi:MAG: hypothetical protein ING29_12870 [Azospirillum sp.]|nr:hypothetical protein [Azospirillum sp.]